MGGILGGIVIFSATVLLVCARIRSCAIFVYVLYLVLVSIESSQGGSFCVFFFCFSVCVRASFSFSSRRNYVRFCGVM